MGSGEPETVNRKEPLFLGPFNHRENEFAQRRGLSTLRMGAKMNRGLRIMNYGKLNTVRVKDKGWGRSIEKMVKMAKTEG